MPDAINGMIDYVRAEIPDHVHLGEIVAIDVDSGRWEVADSLLRADHF